ncbi:unnamed protein product [Clonostachys chloroleuca]|uniref:Uncharacterized protein n=1 Tax=Clonostachys chloroleuca TaxID=1926264 RepID=A0AA35M6K8_9HYPO|nr:unnamed protein product [Clonostachys chloroleuca]CAI6074357.1 unnamed protein product [Clonostachys chloroleuca]CAI6091480.1 unnamed protein product [Clonostachys chloroleuca]
MVESGQYRLMLHHCEQELGHSWEMYKLAFEYATEFNMHNPDGEDSLSGSDKPKEGEDRKGLWEPIQLSLFLRFSTASRQPSSLP